MGIFTRLFARRSKDPYWEGFIHKPVSGDGKDLTATIRSAPEGASFPVKSDVPEPARMSGDLAELARFLGADAMGVAALEPLHLVAEEPSVPTDDPEDLAAAHPFVVMCTVHTEYDPASAKGIGGQHALHESVSVNFSISAYIRELGYRATVRPVDAVAVAVAAGLGTRSRDGRLITKEHGARVYVGDGVLTDLPLALGCPPR